MLIARYKIVRDIGKAGFLSSNRPSTDAFGAIHIWLSGGTGRYYNVQSHEDDALVVDLTWSESDLAVGADLENVCRAFGVARSHISTHPV